MGRKVIGDMKGFWPSIQFLKPFLVQFVKVVFMSTTTRALSRNSGRQGDDYSILTSDPILQRGNWFRSLDAL